MKTSYPSFWHFRFDARAHGHDPLDLIARIEYVELLDGSVVLGHH